MAFRVPLYIPITPAPIMREYTGNGTWNKPSGLTELYVVAVGAGGGGGSGRMGNASTGRAGGGGAGGGASSVIVIPVSELTSASYSITVGSGGNGGVKNTTNQSNGTLGAAGGSTSFGTLVTARGGGGGFGGTTAGSAGNGGAGGLGIPSQTEGPWSTGGQAGGQGRSSGDAASGLSGFNKTGSAASGGGGGGTSTINSLTNGGAGGGIFNLGVLIAGPPATTGDSSAAATGSNDLNLNLLSPRFIITSQSFGPGSGGSGGRPDGAFKIQLKIDGELVMTTTADGNPSPEELSNTLVALETKYRNKFDFEKAEIVVLDPKGEQVGSITKRDNFLRTKATYVGDTYSTTHGTV
jgi:hypothetical protein